MKIKFEDVATSDLYLDAVYEAGKSGNLKSEVLSKLMSVSNSGGFRKSKTYNKKKLSHVVLFSNGKESTWKNHFIDEGNKFIYYGDNNKPGNHYLNTKKKGNKFLEEIFYFIVSNQREKIPPIFLFEAVKNEGRTVRFKGMLVPHLKSKNENDPLLLTEFETNEGYFSNYIATFDILKTKFISRKWIDELKNDAEQFEYAPEEWHTWVCSGDITKLICEDELMNANERNILAANKLSKENIQNEKLFNSNSDLKTSEIIVVQYNRSQDVISHVLRRAAGICEICCKPAPFIRKSDGSPYLEVHHVIALSDGGNDSIDNTKAVCPNCHRYEHFGQK